MRCVACEVDDQLLELGSRAGRCNKNKDELKMKGRELDA